MSATVEIPLPVDVPADDSSLDADDNPLQPARAIGTASVFAVIFWIVALVGGWACLI
jgi:hypothetical protein